jgi:hypothetical protein
VPALAGKAVENFPAACSSAISSPPLSGALIALFTVEQLVNRWRNGFAGHDPNPPSSGTAGSISRHDRQPADRNGFASMPLNSWVMIDGRLTGV